MKFGYGTAASGAALLEAELDSQLSGILPATDADPTFTFKKRVTKTMRQFRHFVAVFALLATSACAGDTATSPSGTSNRSGTGSPTPTGGSNSTTGLRTSYCTTLGSYSTTSWATIPNLPGLDVKLFYQGTFQAAEVTFRNRYQSTIYFSAEVYRAGINPAPATTGSFSMSAGREDTSPIGYFGSARNNQGVVLGSQACVVVDKVRFGSDTGPYYNP